ncbi:MAG: imidazole glycerol phosphate synthase subunit HisF [Clostridiales bacterium]|nr:imidazole glycerol phosphate synthase subunit HisF [Clostridiales bacterium]
MNNKRIIPCLDVNKGRVVKGVNFVNLKDAGDPVEIAKAYNEARADELVFLDITATTEDRDTTLDMVRRIAEVITIPFTVGGGIRTLENIEKILSLGATKVAINSAAISNPNLIKEAVDKFGSHRIVSAIDARRKEDGQGWLVLESGGQDAGLDVIEWARRVCDLGAGEILLTSFDKDGTKDGYDLELTREVAKSVTIPVIASGGAGKKEDFYDALTIGCADGALAASLFHFKEIEIIDLKQYLKDKGININI